MRAAFNLTEAEIRYAMANSRTNADAARFLHVSINAYRKYSSMYFDHESGLNLWQLHRNKPGHSVKKYRSHWIVKIEDIFAGKHPTYPAKKIKQRLIEEGIVPDQCMICGFHEQRMTDYTVPTTLVFKNGNHKDHTKENMELVCWNCFYLYYGEVKFDRFAKVPIDHSADPEIDFSKL